MTRDENRFAIRPLNQKILCFEDEAGLRELKEEELARVSGGERSSCDSLMTTCRTFICTCEGPPPL